jgi:hypothetical protein
VSGDRPQVHTEPGLGIGVVPPSHPADRVLGLYRDALFEFEPGVVVAIVEDPEGNWVELIQPE